ncbi:hypothetical protein [Cysteiniphilum litorale]|uniref:hypothetical protein n=1 Tax=Cysteiniphilum litorale TaxID=2056700 RepID=UPI000E344018
MLCNQKFTNLGKELCAYYGMNPTRNNKGVSHENGSVESSHGHLKNRIKQELMVRGSKDFKTLSEYEQWLHHVVENSNRRNSKNFKLEQSDRVSGAVSPDCPQNRAYGSVHGSSC